MSILTEEKYFDGSLKHLKDVRKITKLPILRKDFIIDPYQILESKIYRADAILLIVSILNDEQIKMVVEYIEPEFWQIRMKRKPTDYDWVKEIMEKAGL